MILYENACVFTPDASAADSFVTENGKFIFVGHSTEAKKQYPNAEIIDLNGQFVCPGFNDSHMHLLGLGSMLMQAQLSSHTD